ncbi:protein timeless isoform X1 [Drosophila persimilis]|uniref:protein timeless isoform X1 n=1 Tax=Drosophila persimilis TaxID=7234 RepID=UPI000F083FA4|nr:protein timeless isoform X1 [Drosophila persimilis]XP_026844948.1 protein timeless isoform X1 [Drosophila persimilis]
MDWLLTAPQLHSAFASLGSLEGDTYVVSPNALSILEEINHKLTYEDQTLRTFRRAICFGQNVRSDLIPLLENAKDDAVLESVIRILVNLTVPVECLFSVDVMYRTDVGRHTIFELNKLLYTSKEAFTEAKSTKSVVEYMKHILESDPKLSPQKCDQINNCLLLLRNILHIPETHGICVMPMMQSNNLHGITMQNTILWNLFIQSIDKLLIYLMTCPQRSFWGVTMVQLIALIYKDQHVSTLQKLLDLWFEASLSESSEDNESNTTPPKQGSGESSPMLTSDPTGSDSSDNGSQGRGMSISMSLNMSMSMSMNVSMSSLCGKKETPEERQLALWEGTEATLQEVSRKGQEYQDAIDAKERMGSAGMDDDEDYEDSDFIHLQLHQAMQAEEEDEECDNEVAAASSEPLNLKTQPADNVNDTTTTTSLSSSIMPFRSPLPVGSRPSYSHAPPQHQSYAAYVAAIKLSQKSPHAGKLQLTKGKCCPQKRECSSTQSELSDCGYATQVENQESVSTSSNDDDMPQGKPLHQKPPCNTKLRNKQRPILPPLDKKELRRKKLVKRSKSSLINMKGLVQHIPTDDDIANLLKEFTVDFLLKGYNYLVEDLHAQLLTNTLPIDTSHFFWLVTYFLKFAAQLELDMEHIDTILTYDVLSYLTYEGVMQCEQLEQCARQRDSDLKPHLRRMHLLVTAIREFLQAIEAYNKVSHLSDDDRDHLRQLHIQIADTSDLHCLFVLLLRRFNPTIYSKQYLQDLIVTNHILLLILDNRPQLDGKKTENLTQHVAQFATLEVMHYYGILLEDFTSNGEFVNDCIFTMMHHVGGDLEQIGVLFQPIILKTYSRIWEMEFTLCDDWSDLIEYVINKFMNTPPKTPMTIPTTSLTAMTKEHNLEHAKCSWNADEMDTLYWYFVQSRSTNDVVGKIVRLFSNNGNKEKSRISIIQQLLQQDIITLLEYDDLMRYEDAEYQRTLLNTPTSVTTESGIEMKDGGFGRPSGDIQILLDLIIKDQKGQHLEWVQKVLLECCYIKLNLKSGRQMPHIMEPVAYHYILLHKSIPVVQWNNEQSAAMMYQPFVLLLHKLGIQLPVDAGSIFARIPDYWSPAQMYGMAKKLGPVNKQALKFDATELEEAAAAAAASAAASAASMRSHHNRGPRNSLSSQSSLEVDMGDTDGELPLIPEVDAAVEKAHAMDCSSSSNNEFFAVPKVKTANTMMRYTPDTTPPVPNWLQLVMRSKRNPRPAPIGEINDCISSTAIVKGDDECKSSRSLCSTMYQTGQTMAMTPMPPMNAIHPLNTMSIMPRLHSIMGPHNENSSSSGCGGTVYSQAMGVLMTTSAVGAIMRGDVEEDAAIKSSFEKLEVKGTHFARASHLEEEYSAMVADAFKNEIFNDNGSVASDLTRMYVSDEDEKHEFRVYPAHTIIESESKISWKGEKKGRKGKGQ